MRIVNAAGPWVERVIRRNAGSNTAHHVRLVKGSHIVVPKFWDGPQAYLFQNDDHRVIFVNPYQGDLCLIGTTDIPYSGDARWRRWPAKTRSTICCRVVNRFCRRQLDARTSSIRFRASGRCSTITPRILRP